MRTATRFAASMPFARVWSRSRKVIHLKGGSRRSIAAFLALLTDASVRPGDPSATRIARALRLSGPGESLVVMAHAALQWSKRTKPGWQPALGTSAQTHRLTRRTSIVGRAAGGNGRKTTARLGNFNEARKRRDPGACSATLRADETAMRRRTQESPEGEPTNRGLDYRTGMVYAAERPSASPI